MGVGRVAAQHLLRFVEANALARHDVLVAQATHELDELVGG